MKNCKTCGKEINKKGKTGYCRSCYPKTDEAKKKNSDGCKRAHQQNPEKWKFLDTDKRYGFASKEWILEHPEIYKKSGKTRSENINSGKSKSIWGGKNLSIEHREKISIKRIKYLENNPNHGLKWFIINGIKVQGTWEKKFAEFLTDKNIKWSRKRIIYKKIRRYTPDFYCIDYNCYFEVKGFRRDRDIYKMYLVLDENPDIKIKMIEKEQLKNIENIDIFNLPNFQELYHRENIDISKFKNVWK